MPFPWTKNFGEDTSAPSAVNADLSAASASTMSILKGTFNLLRDMAAQLGGGLPASVGQKAMAASLPVVIASDQSAVSVTSAPPAAIFSGVKAVTTAGTDEVLAASQALAVGVRVKAHLANTGTIYVGPENVAAATGYRLLAGDEVFLPVDNLADVWLDASVSAEGVSYVAS